MGFSRAKVYTPHVQYAGGGSVTTSLERIREAVKSRNNWEVYEKEQEMCRVLARNGYEVVHRHGGGRGNSYDVTVNGIKADLKRTSGVGNLHNYAQKAVNEQGASITIFQFDNESSGLHRAIEKTCTKRISRDVFLYGPKG